MKAIKFIVVIFGLSLASVAVNASWISIYQYSKFEGGHKYILQSNLSNESQDVRLELYPNSQDEKVFVIKGLPYDMELMTYLPDKHVFFTPYKIRVGKDIYSLKGGSSVVQDGKLSVILADDIDRNPSLIPKIEYAINKGDEFAIQFIKSGAVYTFSGGVKKVVQGK